MLKPSRSCNHPTFLCKCRENNVLPKGLSIKPPVKANYLSVHNKPGSETQSETQGNTGKETVHFD
ncbi:hypothetical protein PR048_014008 [Dryococelus australis]|uniref:Uncharacterized protein n=1 Tax=Dryococelus australis TaxID=614101 RepID=A0ABQ9HTR8_9NEOP|nr:hypothetical protein PR048_014008 [Dryococelus australis]